MLCLIGGILVDRLVGLRLGLLIVVSSVLLGQIIWAIGGFTDKYFIMLAGCFFIGAGNELVIVIDHAFKAVWFKKDLALAVSIDAAFGRIGGTLAILLPQVIYDSFSIFRSSNSRLGVTLTTHSCWIHDSRTNLLSISNHYNYMDYKKEEPISNPKSGIKSILIRLFKQVSLTFSLITVVYAAYFPSCFHLPV